MRVIVPGRNQEGWKTEVVCMDGSYTKGCGARLEVEKKDLFLAKVHDFGGRREEAHAVCPCCKNEFCVPGEFAGLPSKESFLAAQQPPAA